MTQVNGMANLSVPPSSPQGRLAPATATPVPVAAVTAATSVFYCLYEGGNQVPIWNGNAFQMMTFAELSNVLANSATGNAGPAAGAAAKVYDLFIWIQGGVLYLTRDVAWTNDTTPVAGGTGPRAGLNLVNGILVNANAITNGPAAGFGTWVGVIGTDAGGATVTYDRGSSAASGGAAVIGVWNCYNRVDVDCAVQDSTAGWSYTLTQYRSANASASNRATFVRGLNEDGVTVSWSAKLAILGGALFTLGLGLDGTIASSNTVSSQATTTGPAAIATGASPVAIYSGSPGLGRHFIQAIEAGDGANATGVDMRYGGLYASLRA